MIKRNTENGKLVIEWNKLLKIFIIVVGLVSAYYITLGDIKTNQALMMQTQEINGQTIRNNKANDTIINIRLQRIEKILDSLVIVLQVR